MARLAAAAAVLAAGAGVRALDNGEGLTPAMGFSSWNAYCANVTSDKMRAIVGILLERGLAGKGFVHVNVDEGWLAGRYDNGTLYEDRTKFPEGMRAFGQWVHSQVIPDGPFAGQTLKYGLYTSRGSVQCGESNYGPVPGSLGHEAEDVQWMAGQDGAQADYLKVDSCGGSQNHSVAFAEYGLYRDALNATGRRVYFSLCGWEEWYAPVGYSLGNQWRIAGDGDSWPALTNCFNTIARVRQYSGPGGWADPDLLVGPNSHGPHPTGTCDGTFITDLQARTQFSLWSVISAPLLISNDLTEASDYYFETLGNDEVIAVDQDPAGIPGARLLGDDLAFPCTPGPAGNGSLPPGAYYAAVAAPCNASDPLQHWAFDFTSYTIALQGGGSGPNGEPLVLDVYGCAKADGSLVVVYPKDPSGSGTCGGNNQMWGPANSTTGGFVLFNVNAAPSVLDVHDFTGPAVDLWTWNGGANQRWVWSGQLLQSLQPASPPLCLAAAPPPQPAVPECTNVWARTLHDGTAAVVFVNNGPSPVNVTCGPACFAGANMTAPAPRGQLVVRDLWAHAEVDTLAGGPGAWSYTVEVPGEGGSVTVKVTPQ